MHNTLSIYTPGAPRVDSHTHTLLFASCSLFIVWIRERPIEDWVPSMHWGGKAVSQLDSVEESVSKRRWRNMAGEVEAESSIMYAAVKALKPGKAPRYGMP